MARALAGLKARPILADDPLVPDHRVLLRQGPGHCVELAGDDVLVRLWWRFGRLDPGLFRALDNVLSDVLAARIGHRIVLDLREAPPVIARPMRRALERLLAIATLARRPILVRCGSASIQRRDLADLVRRTAPGTCIAFPAASLPPLPEAAAA